MTRPDIHIDNPYKERVAIIGMIQEGKTNFLKWLLHITPVPFTVFDTLGQVNKGGFKVLNDKQKIITPRFAQRQAVFQKTCKDVWNQGNMVFAIDEVSEFCSKWELPDHLGVIVKMGGNRNIGLWVTTQRVAQVHNDILAGCKHHFIFRTYLPQDVEWYSKVVPKEIILMSKDLPAYHFIYYKLGHEPQLFKPVDKMS